MSLFGKSNTQAVIKYSQLQVNTSMLDVPITYMVGQRRMSANLVWANDFKKHNQSGKGKGGLGKSAQYTYTAAVILALGEGPFDSCVNVWIQGATATAKPLSATGYSLMLGTASQAPETYVTTNHPTEALAYAYTAYVFNPNEDLGSSATVPNDAFEMVRLLGFTDTLTAAGWTNPKTHVNTPGTDCSFADIIPDLLCNPQYGINFSLGDFFSLTDFRAYQDGQGFYFSPLLVNQEKATSVLDRWAAQCNSWIFWDGTLLRCLPLGDSSIGSFVPDLAPAYDLSTADGSILDGTIQIDRKDPADCQNRMVLEYSDRTRGYVSTPVEYKDQTLNDLFGKRDGSSTQAGEICNPAVAATAVYLIGRRAAYIRQFPKWKSPYRFVRLIPGSIVTISDPNQNLNKLVVRITDVDEDAKGSLSFQAEELVQGIGTYQTFSTQVGGGQTNPPLNQDPGNVNTPGVVESNSALTNGVAQVIISASGGINWGGCFVNASFDGGSTYTVIGEIKAPAPQGLLTSSLAAYGGANPDVTNTLAVDATESQTPPQTVTNADAQAFRTLSLISAQPTLVGGFEVLDTAGELLAFGNTAATGTFTANLTYLERGLYGTSPGSHASGTQFSMIDVSNTKGCTLFYTLPTQYVGATICLKFQSFNTFGQETQDLSVCTAYKYTTTGAGFGGGGGSGGGGGNPGTPVKPTGLAINGATLTWTANPVTDKVLGYEIFRANGTGAAFGSSSQIGQAGAGSTSFVDTTAVTGSAYTYFVVAVNLIGPSAPSAGVSTSSSGGPGAVGGSLRVAGGTPGRLPLAGEEILNPPMATGDILPATAGAFTKAFLKCEIAPTSTWTILFKQNGTTVATGTIAAGATTGSFSGVSANVVFSDGDLFTGVCISPQDATCSGVAYAIFGTRTS